MALNNSSDIQKLFDRKGNSADYLNTEVQREAEIIEQIASWEQFFEGLWDAPLNRPKNVQILIRRHLPSRHPENETGLEVQIPFLFSFEDDDSNRWMGMIYSLGKGQVDWQFLLFKPDDNQHLRYLLTQTDLLSVVNSAQVMYISRPQEVGTYLARVKREELTPAQLPAPNSWYTDNLWFNTNDLFYGMNMVNAQEIQRLAGLGRFI